MTIVNLYSGKKLSTSTFFHKVCATTKYQRVERGVSFASGFQFLLRLAVVFAEEVGEFGAFATDGPI
jgi:hypothetical protein